MNNKKNTTEKIQQTEQRLLELLHHAQILDNEYQQLLEELAVTYDQLKDFVENSENFSAEVWEELQNEKKKLDENLNLELSNIRDVNKIKNTLSESGKVQKHWLFIR